MNEEMGAAANRCVNETIEMMGNIDVQAEFGRHIS